MPKQQQQNQKPPLSLGFKDHTQPPICGAWHLSEGTQYNQAFLF